MDFQATKKTIIGIIAGLGVGYLVMILVQAGMRDLFGLDMPGKIVGALSGLGIIIKWCWDFHRKSLQEINDKLDSKVDKNAFDEYKKHEHEIKEEIMSTLNHIRDTIDKHLLNTSK